MGLLSMLTRRVARQTEARRARLVELVQQMDRAAEAGASGELKVRRAELGEYVASLADDAQPEALKVCAMGSFDLASNLREGGDFPEAESSYGMAEVALSKLAAHKRYASFANSQLAACKNHLGLLNLEKADYLKAATAFDEAIAIREEIARRSPKDHENLVYLGGALCNRGLAARDMGQSETARSYFEKSLRTLDSTLSKCDCGSAEALAVMISRMRGGPHWLLVAFQFRKNAADGLASVGGPGVNRSV